MTEENIFNYFEREKSIKLPNYIKNLLIFAGFDNKISLSKLEGDDITEMEKIARHIVPCIIDKPNQAKYLGNFENHPELFCIFPGHRKLLQEISQFYKNFSYKKRNLEISETSNKRNDSQSEITKSQNRPRDVDTERQNILSLLFNWINNFCSRYLSPEEAAHVNREINKLKVDISSADQNQCFVTCCICLKELKIFRNQNGFWIMSNIHKHFKTHLNGDSNKKFSKNISISSSISTSINQDDVYVGDDEMKQEMEFDYSRDC